MAIAEHIPFYFSSEDAGAPQASSDAGASLGILAACLSTGFNLKTATSLTVASGVATLTCNNHGFTSTAGKIIEIKGATPAALNGKWQPTYHDTNTLKFNCPGVADGTATGTITVQRAALGWQQKFTDGHKCIFKRTNPQATAMELYVDDSNVAPATQNAALVKMLEGSNDINTHIDASPNRFWTKRGNGYSAGREWMIIGNSRCFYFLMQAGSRAAYSFNFFFGDVLTENNTDAYRCLLAATNISTTSWGGIGVFTAKSLGTFNNGSQSVFARKSDQISKAARACTQTLTDVRIGYRGYVAAVGLVRLHWPVYVKEYDVTLNHPPRGILPGLIEPLVFKPYPHKQIVSQSGAIAGSLLAVHTSGSSSIDGSAVIDLTGDLWQLPQ